MDQLHRPGPWLVLLLIAGLWCGCSDSSSGNGGTPDTEGDTVDEDGGGGPDAETDPSVDAPDAEPDGNGDVEAPELRDVRATIEGDLGSEVDLNQRDQVRVLPVSTTIRFRIFTSDDESATADLTVEVVDGEGDDPVAVPDQTAEIRNGLWNVAIEASAGSFLRVRVEDEAGNVALSPNALISPSFEDAVADDWNQRYYDTEQAETHRLELSIDAEGSWLQSHNETEFERGGTWTLNGENILLTETFRTDPDGVDDDNQQTVELQEVWRYHVDDRFMAIGAYSRDSGSGGVAGTWSRTVELWEPDGESLALVESRTETVVLSMDDTWTETWEGSQYEGNDETPLLRSWSGTWEIEPTDNYTENLGDFLVRVVDTVDGEALEESQTRFELFNRRLDRLLIVPLIRQSDED